MTTAKENFTSEAIRAIKMGQQSINAQVEMLASDDNELQADEMMVASVSQLAMFVKAQSLLTLELVRQQQISNTIALTVASGDKFSVAGAEKITAAIGPIALSASGVK